MGQFNFERKRSHILCVSNSFSYRLANVESKSNYFQFTKETLGTLKSSSSWNFKKLNGLLCELTGISTPAQVESKHQHFTDWSLTEVLELSSDTQTGTKSSKAIQGARRPPQLHLSPGQKCVFKPVILTIPIF